MAQKAEILKKNERYLIFDESGNLGSSGRYFVIACIDTNNYKALHNIMHKKLGIAKKMFHELSILHSNEIKAKEAYPCIKYHTTLHKYTQLFVDFKYFSILKIVQSLSLYACHPSTR